jgi:peptide/nickel transport system permease protein
MIHFVLKRLAALVLTLLAASFLVFAVTEFSPGDVARKTLGPYALQEQVDDCHRPLGEGAR